MKIRLALPLGVLALSAVIGCVPVAQIAERIGNPVVEPGPNEVTADAQALHSRLGVVDLHADTMLSTRDLGAEAGFGHVDLPRLLRGGVAVQVFSAPSNMPFCLGVTRCAEGINVLALLSVVAARPPATWVSDQARVLEQAERLHALAARDPRLVILRTRDDLAALLAGPPGRVGGILAIEGAQAVGDDAEGVDRLFDAGFRLLGLTHFLDNRVAGSAHGLQGYGITDLGEKVLDRARALGMIVDLAHASPRAIDDFLARPDRGPFLVSHTGVRHVCDTARNLSDEQIAAIIRAGGLIGLGGWPETLCLDRDAGLNDYLDHWVKAIRHVTEISDAIDPSRTYDFIALGSDFDGYVRVGFDAGSWALLTERLLRERMPAEAITAIMGGNACRFLLRALPGSKPPPAVNACQSPRGRASG